jgi:hypothetical protein
MTIKSAAPAAAAAVLALALSATAGAHPSVQPVARAAATCSVGSGEGDGYTYLETLMVTNTSCSTGKSIVKHKGKVKGWHCSRKVLDKSSIQYDAVETCTNGRKRVKYEFSQNT